MGFDECGPVHSAPEGCTRSELDLDLDAGGDFEAHQCLNGLLGGVEDVDKALVGAALELLTAVLVLVDCTKDSDDLGLGGQGDGAGNLCIGACR